MSSGPNADDAVPIETVTDRYLDATAKGRRTGNYRSMAASALDRLTAFLRDGGVTAVGEIDDSAMRRYAQDLREAYRDGDIAAATATTYYATARACLQWAVEDGLLAENPAAAERATTELPDDTGTPERQFWDQQTVQRLVGHLTSEIDARLDADGVAAAAKPVRDRALVSTLAYSGVRGAEVFRDTDDGREGRQGLRWHRVNLADGALNVLGKTQDWEWAQLPERARDHLRRHRRVQDPPTEEWPVFPTAHAPSKYGAVRTQLGERGWDDDEIATLLDDADIDAVLREHEVVPPSITVRGARSLLKRLCEAADVDADGEYLKPHGARRGLGDVLYRESAELAQSALRHTSIRTTHDAYSHIDATETAESVSTALDEAIDGPDESDE